MGRFDFLGSIDKVRIGALLSRQWRRPAVDSTHISTRGLRKLYTRPEQITNYQWNAIRGQRVDSPRDERGRSRLFSEVYICTRFSTIVMLLRSVSTSVDFV